MSDLHFDFEAALVLATLVTGVFWALDRYRWQARRDEDEKAAWPVEFSRSFFPVILAVLLLRSFLFEPFRIPSSSMVPTLLRGDFILVNKFGYGLRLPVRHTEFLPLGKPERGDVAVFRYPPNPRMDFIKRVVGLPGDVIVYRDKHLYVNGEPVSLESLGVYTGPGAPSYETALAFEEVLGERRHRVLHVRDRNSIDLRAEVPAGHYFVMGDNRDNSADSRRWGFVPEENLVGRAFLIWLSVDAGDWKLRFSRLGESIR
jgi:signal peptidase I